MAVKTRGRRPSGERLAERIVDTAIHMAEEVGWNNLRLRLIAERLGISLSELSVHFRDLDAVADAWFRRARSAMLAPAEEGFAELPARERLHRIMMRWFDALAGHRRVTAEMLATKLYPSHPHHWVPLIFNLSRTIQWVRDAAGLDAGGGRRQVEEVGLTLLFLATLAVWVRDDTPDQERTRRFLDQGLAAADRGMVGLYGPGRGPG
ncbi:MAG: hypothetical protein ACE5LL_03730 [Alphaproteobacteria bacterium]